MPVRDTGLLPATDVQARVLDRLRHGAEQVALMRQSPDRANRPQDLQVLRADALDQHRDAAILELGDDLTECLRAGRVEHLDVRHAQDHDPDVAGPGQDRQEALRGAEEERAIQAIDDDMLVKELRFLFGADLHVRAERLSLRPRC